MPSCKMRLIYVVQKVMLLGCLMVIAPLSASADYSGTIISYNCDKAHDQIVIEYHGGVNNAFDELINKKGPNAWNPWDLVTVDKDRITKVKKIVKTCKLSDGEYKITISPEPGNWNIQGQLGAAMSAWVKISKNGKEIIHKTMEELRQSDAPVIAKIVLKAKEPQPIITEVKWEDFYK